MKNQLKIIAGVLLISLVVQSIAFGNVSVLNSNNFLSNPSNDQGKKKGKDQKDDKHHDNHKQKDDHHSNGGHNNGSLSIKVDLGKELKVETHQGDNHKGKGHGKGKGKGNKHVYYGHPSDFGQHRAYEARNKHKHFKPKKEKEAYEGIQIISRPLKSI